MEFTEIVKFDNSNKDLIIKKSKTITSKEVPKKYIKKRAAKGGGTWKYAKADYFEDMLNEYFPGWSFDTQEPKIVGREGSGFVYVTCKLAVNDEGTIRLISDVGGAQIKYYGEGHKNAGDYLDLPNDVKAAITDGFKRCCYRLGFARDLKYDPADLDISELQFQMYQAAVENLKPDFKEKYDQFVYANVTRANFDAFMKETILKLLEKAPEKNAENIKSIKDYYGLE